MEDTELPEGAYPGNTHRLCFSIDNCPLTIGRKECAAVVDGGHDGKQTIFAERWRYPG